MPQVQDFVIVFLDEVRASSYTSQVEDPAGERIRVPGNTTEVKRTFDVPGRYEDTGSMTLFAPQNTDFQRIQELLESDTEKAMSVSDGIVVGDEARVRAVQMTEFAHGWIPLRTFESGYSVSAPGQSALGINVFFDAAVTGAVDSASFEVTGGVPAGTKLVWNIHPWAKTAGASTVDHQLESASDSVFTTPVVELVLTDFTETGGGIAARGPAIRAELDGDVSPITNTFFRYSVTAVSALSWSIAVFAALVRK